MMKTRTIYLLSAREIQEKRQNVGIDESCILRNAQRTPYYILGKFLLKEKELHSIEVDSRYKQAHTLILRVYTP